MKRKLLVGIVISAAFLYFALRDIEWVVLGQVLRRTRMEYLLASVAFTALNLYLRAWRWKFMMQPIKAMPMSNLFSALSIGYMANNLLPARLGEIVRAYVVGKKEGISRTASFATIVYERVVDVFALLLLLWITFFKISAAAWLRRTGWMVLLANVALFVLIFIMERNRRVVESIISRVAGPLPERTRMRLSEGTTSFLSGLAAVSRLATITPIAISSALVWLAAIMAVYVCFAAVGIDVPFHASITILVLVSFGSMIPSAPAYVGTTQYACIVGLAIYGIGKSEALAFSLLYHAAVFFPVTALGLAYLWREGIRLNEISRDYESGRAKGASG